MKARTLLTVIAFFLIGVIVAMFILAVWDANDDDWNIPRLGYGVVAVAAITSLGLVARSLGQARSVKDS